MTVDQILQHLYSRINKDQSGNTYNIDRFNNDMLVANIEMFSWYYGLPQGYQPGVPLPSVSAEITQKVTDSLRHLIVNMGGDGPSDPGPLSVVNGIAILPKDYVHVDYINYSYIDTACSGKVTYPLIDVLTGAQWSNRISSATLNESGKIEFYPYCNFQKDYIQFRPKNISFVNFVYWRSPKAPRYDYYIDVNDNIVYMPEGTSHTLLPGETGSAGQTSGTVFSTTSQLEWPEDVHPDFANFLLSYIADNLRSQELKQSSELRKANGV